MSSEIHKHIETSLKKNLKSFNADVISFPIKKNKSKSKDLKIETFKYWNIKDKSNEDQLKAVIGVCFMFVALILIGLYSNFV
tara:strand:+ start:634 stop:879 length:246 start_codon:yes stop_codon:yes gene_type:complete